MPNFRPRLNYQSFKSFVDYLKYDKQDFVLTSTNYTKTILWGSQKFVFNNTHGKNSWLFPCAKKIKDDIKASNVIIDEVPRYDIYFHKPNDLLKRLKGDYNTDVTCIDLNSAYLRVLLNNKMITQDTFDYVQNTNKATRLQSVGMLATNKLVFTFKKGKQSGAPQILCDKFLRNYFFFCCNEVGELMREVSLIAGNDFYFFWVDGIYISKDFDYEILTRLCEQKGFKVKVDHLQNVTFANQSKHLHFSYLTKDKDGNDDFKVFNIPFEDYERKSNIQFFIKELAKEAA